MTQRPVIRWRIGIIVFIGLLSVAQVPIALFYSAQGIGRTSSLLQPQQLAAIVSLVEETSAGERPALFAAMQSTQLSLRVVYDAAVATDLSPFWSDNENELSRYQAALGDRTFAAYAVRRSVFNGGFLSPLTAAEFRIALREGGVLIAAVESLAMFNRNGLPIGFPAAFLGVMVAFVALLLLNLEFRAVLRLAKAVEGLDPSDSLARLPKLRAGTAEVRALISAFDRQQDRVATLLRSRSAMVGGIQHDVRTFATRLRLRAEKLPSDEDRAQAEADIADLVALMDSALLATRSEAGELNLELLDLTAIIETDVRDLQKAGKSVRLAVETNAGEIAVLADRLGLRRIIYNLIENAIRYGKAAHVHIELDAECVRVLVDDEGPGIPADQKQDLLEPFVRQEPSRSRDTGGAGLGLAIVNALVSGHDGTLTITDAPTGGARFVVELPRFQANE